MKRLVRLAFLGAIVMLLLAGCARQAPAPAPQTAGPYGELRIGATTFGGERFYPVKASSEVLVTLPPMFDFLFRIDNEGRLAPGIVERWELAPDGLSWLYFVHKGIKFHNGDVLTAKDVKFTIDRYTTDSARTHLKDSVKSTEIVDDYTVRVLTIGKQPFLPYISTMYSPYLGQVTPKDYFERMGEEPFNRNPVGSGPFKFVRYSPGDMVEYEAVGNHWRQTPAFKTLKVLQVPDETTRVAMLKTGTIDIIDISPDSIPDLEKSGLRTGALMADQPGFVTFGALDPLAAGKPTSNIKVRQALSLAIDRNEIGKSLFHKFIPPAPPFIWQGSADADFSYWQDYAAKVYRYDPAEAKRLLTEAGYAQGFNIKIFTGAMGGAPYLPKLSEVVAAYWSKVGVKAEITVQDWGALQPRVARGAATRDETVIGNVFTYSVSGGPVVPLRLRAAFHSRGNIHMLEKAMPEVDKLIDDTMSETDPAKRKVMTTELIKKTTDSYTFLMTVGVALMAGIGPDIDISFPAVAPSTSSYVEMVKHRKR